MNRRASILGSSVLLVVLVGLMALLAYTYAGSTAAPAIGGPFALTDTEGRTVTDRDFRGKWMLIYFGYTHCPDACPTALSQMEAALDRLGPEKAKEIRPIFITIDPERDTPAVMKDYVAAFGSNLTGLTGTPATLAPVEHGYRVYSAKHPTGNGDYDMDHSSVIYLMGPDGRFVTNFTSETKSDEMAAALGKVVG